MSGAVTVVMVKLATLATVCSLILSGCLSTADPHLSLTVSGDVEQVITVSRNDVLIERVAVDGSTYRAVALTAVLELAGADQPESILLIGDDGHSAVIEARSGLDRTWLALRFSGWQFVSSTYPVNSWIKDLRELVVVGPEAGRPAAITLERDLAVLGPGHILSRTHRVAVTEAGGAARTVDGVTYRADTFSRRRGAAISDLVPDAVGRSLVAVLADGRMVAVTSETMLVADGNRTVVTGPDGRNADLVGIVVDPPPKVITDLKNDVLSLIDGDHRVLVVIVDGLGWQAYTYARTAGIISSLTAGTVVPALTVFPPITPVAVAAMLTGELPPVTGISSRQDRRLLVPTVLDDVLDRGKRAVLIEGSLSPVSVPSEQLVLNTDRNRDGFVDDEIFESTMVHLAAGYDLVVAHFHSVDDMGHAHGPLAGPVLERLAVVDRYVGELVAAHAGPVIVLSDHGMHRTSDGGNHGRFCRADMFVPYITFDGGAL